MNYICMRVWICLEWMNATKNELCKHKDSEYYVIAYQLSQPCWSTRAWRALSSSAVHFPSQAIKKGNQYSKKHVCLDIFGEVTSPFLGFELNNIGSKDEKINKHVAKRGTGWKCDWECDIFCSWYLTATQSFIHTSSSNLPFLLLPFISLNEAEKWESWPRSWLCTTSEVIEEKFPVMGVVVILSRHDPKI